MFDKTLKWICLATFLAGAGCEKKTERAENAPPTVAVARVTRENLAREVSIPGEFRPYEEVELHAKVSGYLQKMNVDFGDTVKAGQILAVIEVPEMAAQVKNAEANAERAEADYTNTHVTFERMRDVNRDHPNLVAQQDIDITQSKDNVAAASVAAAKAELVKYQTLDSYTKLSAPFDGVVTHRYVDPGALVEAGMTSDSAMPLLRISDNYRLRMDFPVSVTYVKDVHPGDEVKVRVESLGGRTFTGTITRSAMRANADTRTMTTELEVTNGDLQLVPGMYASVMFAAERRPNALSIPVQAAPPGQNSSVLVINDQHEVEERPVKLGLETPSQFEVLTGLKEGELVVVGPRSALKAGEKVEPKMTELPALPQ